MDEVQGTSSFKLDATDRHGNHVEVVIAVDTASDTGLISMGARKVQFDRAAKDKHNVPIELSGRIDLLLVEFHVFLTVIETKVDIAIVSAGYGDSEDFAVSSEDLDRLSRWIESLSIPWNSEQRHLRLAKCQDWNYAAVASKFGTSGCSYPGCHYNGICDPSSAVFCCALNLSDALIQAGISLPQASNVNYCDQPPHPNPRVRNADGLARICNAQNGGAPDASGWANRPKWKGIVFFGPPLGLFGAEDSGFRTEPEKNIELAATGHIDLWDGQHAVHASYPGAATVWFWKLG
jgi:hypothetical protein